MEAGMFAKRKGEEKQEEFWIERVSKPPSQGFYSKLNEHLVAMDFARQVGHCASQPIGKRAVAGDVGLILWCISKWLMGIAESHLYAARQDSGVLSWATARCEVRTGL
jgi:hypothetical protein